MYKFKGKSIDARYQMEYCYFETIEGYGLKNNKWDGDTFILYDGEWVKIDPKTLEIEKTEDDENKTILC